MLLLLFTSWSLLYACHLYHFSSVPFVLSDVCVCVEYIHGCHFFFVFIINTPLRIQILTLFQRPSSLELLVVCRPVSFLSLLSRGGSFFSFLYSLVYNFKQIWSLSGSINARFFFVVFFLYKRPTALINVLYSLICHSFDNRKKIKRAPLSCFRFSINFY